MLAGAGRSASIFHRFSFSLQVRNYSKQQPSKQSFLNRLIDNIRDEINKNKEMKESLKNFRAEAEKLENSDALKAARQKFQSVESEANKGK